MVGMRGIPEHDPLTYGFWGSVVGGLVGFALNAWLGWGILGIAFLVYPCSVIGGTLFPAKNPLVNPFMAPCPHEAFEHRLNHNYCPHCGKRL